MGLTLLPTLICRLSRNSFHACTQISLCLSIFSGFSFLQIFPFTFRCLSTYFIAKSPISAFSFAFAYVGGLSVAAVVLRF